MAHNIEQFSDGTAAFVSAREPAWHSLGTVTDGALTAEAAARAARLNGWDVRKWPAYGMEPFKNAPSIDAVDNGTYVVRKTDNGLFVAGRAMEATDYRTTVRDNPEGKGVDLLGMVGADYQIVQNEDAFEVLNHIVDQGGAIFETAGSIRGGKQVFMTLKMPEGILIDGQDAHELYLLATTAHDGSAAFTVAVTPIRVVCQNTLNFALSGARQKWTLRHSSGIKGQIAEARESLKFTWRYAENFEHDMKKLLDVEVTKADFDAIVDKLIPESDSKHEGWRKNREEKRRTVKTLFREADTNDFGRWTAYGALNALVEFADWYWPVKGADDDGVKRATRTIAGGNTVERFKQDAFRLLKA